ncbi:hypothetical protein AB6A40_001737 [Gnathostoma spinigerum]|uniref:RUN domain-containing protein n=1 Tax=Gnathostoma spinigerum TaxID=75299 RepID=A0ABD6EDV1_9BILA
MSNSEHKKEDITKELENVLSFLKDRDEPGGAIANDTSQALCNVVEAAFIHGLRDPFFAKASRYAKYPEPNFWPFLYKYTHVSIKKQIASLNQIRTDIGRARAWIRITLNEGSLENYINMLCGAVADLSKFYKENAYLRDPRQTSLMLHSLKALSRFIINIPVNSSLLNTWIPTPLILSGLITGKPAKQAQQSRSSAYDQGFDGEIGQSALDLLETTSDSQNSTRLTSPGMSSEFSGDEDDHSSIYSHPSMVDASIMKAPYYNLVCSNSDNSGFTGDEEPRNEVRVRRRVRRARHCSRSSSETASRCSRSRNVSQRTIVQDMKMIVEILPHLVDYITTEAFNEALTLNSCDLDKSRVPEEDAVGIVSENGPNGQSFNNAATTSSGFSHISHSCTQCVNGEIRAKDLVREDSVDVEYTKNLFTKTADVAGGNADLHTGDGVTDSLEQELTSTGSVGNSLLGKGWAVSNHDVQDLNHSTGPSSSAGTDISQNFETVLKKAIISNEEEQIETRVRSRVDSEVFTDSLNDNMLTGIEIAQASVVESAGMGSLHATSTMVPRKLSKIEVTDSDEALIVSFDDIPSLDEYGISLDMLPLLITIPREKGLDVQNFRCHSCNKSIGPTFSSYRMCAFDAKYYCDACWKAGETIIIPSRLIRNWDSSPRPVCKANASFISSVTDRPIIRLNKVNPGLYDSCPTMKNILKLRKKMALAVMYLLSCKQSVADDLRKRLWPKEYLFNDVHLYSFTDFLNVLSGQLERHLHSIIDYSVSHIRQCALCAQKGFICELCSGREVIYPFETETTHRCPVCFSVFHKECLKRRKCPKCLRREQYSQLKETFDNPPPLD